MQSKALFPLLQTMKKNSLKFSNLHCSAIIIRPWEQQGYHSGLLNQLGVDLSPGFALSELYLLASLTGILVGVMCQSAKGILIPVSVLIHVLHMYQQHLVPWPCWNAVNSTNTSCDCGHCICF